MALCFPFASVIPLKSDLAVELQEKGKVRFWLQAEKMSANGKVDYVFNDNVLSQGEVSETLNSSYNYACNWRNKTNFIAYFFTEIQNEL